MTLDQLISAINSLSDERETPEEVVSWVNDAIARINVELDADFPYMDSTRATESIAFPEKWQRLLVIPFAVGRVKQKDSSQFEYTDAYAEFYNNLTEMKAKYDVPEEYKDSSSVSGATMDLSANMYSWSGW